VVAPPPRSVAQADAHADGQADDASPEAVDEPPPPVQPPPAVVASSAEEQLAGRILMSSHAMETLTELVTLHPSRVTGS